MPGKRTNKNNDLLLFTHLPGYASFLLANRLDEYVQRQLRISKEEKVPLLRFFSHLTDEQLAEMSKKATREFFHMLISNQASAFITNATTNYVKNTLPSIRREEVIAEDITIISLVRRKVLRSFLSEYTESFDMCCNIMEEVDRFVAQSETASFNAFIQIQQEQINSMHREMEQRYEELLESQEISDMGSFTWDLNGGESKYTPGVFRILESGNAGSLEEFMQHVHYDDQEALTAAINKAISGDGHYDCEYRFAHNGREKKIWSRGQVIFRAGKAVSMRGTIMDVTSRQQMVDQLMESETLNKQSQALTHIGNWSWDVRSGKLTWSDEMYRIYGLEPQEEQISFDRFISFTHPADREQRLSEIEESLKTGISKDYLISIITQDGVQKILKGKGDVIKDKNGNAVKLVGTCQDITKEHQLNKELMDKALQTELLNASLERKNIELEQMNKELESFNYVASHDLQEPLRKIQTFISRIMDKSRHELSTSTLGYLNKVVASSSRMQLLIEDLLLFSQTSASEENFRETDLNLVLDEVKNILSATIEEKNVYIDVQALPPVRAIPFQLQQLFLNLVSNAIKYAKTGVSPRVAISSQLVPGHEIEGRETVSGQSYLELRIADNGIGFEAEYKEKIFDLFQRLHNKDTYSGTGIGLAICKKIVNIHKGFISADSVPGEGSVFHVYLPVEDEGFIPRGASSVN